MAAAVAVPFSAINNQLGGVLPPSAVVQHSPRHGRSRGMSFKGKRARGYSVIEERDTTIAKALMFVLKRTITAEEVDAEEEVDNLVADKDGWVGVDVVLAHPKISAQTTEFSDIQRIIANAIKARFELEQLPNTQDKADEPASWRIRRIVTRRDSIVEPAPVEGEKITLESDNLPEFILYETSYQRYPLLLTSGAIIPAPGGGKQHTFQPFVEDSVPSASDAFAKEPAEVIIWINLKSAMEANPSITWQRTESGAIVTSDEVPKSLWKKAVARRPDIGLLFEDGEVRKEVPASLRGKGAKGRGKKGNRAELKRGGSGPEEDSSASEEVIEEDEE